MNKKTAAIKINKLEWTIFGVLVLIAILTVLLGRSDGKLHLYFLDVGQGDAIFIETPTKNQILIDGGPDDSIIRELGEVMPFYDRSIDMVILTHPDSDHLNGLIRVLEIYKVEKIIETGIFCDTPNCIKWEEQKLKKGAENLFVNMDNKITSDDGLEIKILHPLKDIKGEKVSQKNNTSLVLKLIYGDHSVLLTGDIEKIIEHKLSLSGLNIDSDFLKISHHGSKTSSTEEFLRNITPIAAFIQVGAKNRYGHPTAEVIGRLENFDIPYYRTDRDGRIELILDGQDYKINKN